MNYITSFGPVSSIGGHKKRLPQWHGKRCKNDEQLQGPLNFFNINTDTLEKDYLGFAESSKHLIYLELFRNKLEIKKLFN